MLRGIVVRSSYEWTWQFVSCAKHVYYTAYVRELSLKNKRSDQARLGRGHLYVLYTID